MNILLVDDEKLELEQLEYLLQPYFHNQPIYKVQDVSEAMNIIKKNTIHLAFLDIQLPGRSGLELAEMLKKSSNTKVIMVTAFQSFEYAQQALRIQVEDYITKPIVESELIEIIQPYIPQTAYSDVISQAIELIHQDYGTKLTLTDIANQIHVSHAYLSRKFNEELQMSFPDYLNKFRIKMAKRMLEEKQHSSIAYVAENCGFSSQHYFSSLFKKEAGVTPREYRRKQ
ncbi:response regulator transcription factor [Virgibacillus sp. MG-45]|uniref:response regulator transcription factor n=1 Tax=Virgibacillus sp. MG-45 TaxID=3102791 RepID=UPI002ED9ECC2